MDSAYSGLTGIMNTMIETSAAAERVFSLMECKPDIERVPEMKQPPDIDRKPEISEPVGSSSIMPTEFPLLPKRAE